MKLKNRTTVGVISIVIASTLCFIITPIYNKTLQKDAQVIRMTSDIKKGEKITSDKVKVVETTKKGLPSSVVSNKEEVVGKYAVIDMVKDDDILQDKISKNKIAEDKYLYGLNEEQAISFTIQKFASGLSGKLQTGDIISIISTEDDGNTCKTYTPKELQYVRVLAVTDSVGNDKGEERKVEDDDKELPVTVTVLASKKQAEIIANLEETSKMHVSLIFRGTETDAQKYVDKQNSIIK